jgi:putative protease
MENAQICTQPGYLREKSYLAVCVGYDPETGIAKFIQRNKAKVGDDVEIITPGSFGRALRLESMKNAAGESVESAPHPFMEFYVPVPFEVREGDIMRGAN